MTAVRLLGLIASRRAGGVAVSWRTAGETGILGFNLYRAALHSQAGRRLNRTLISSSGTGAGLRHRWLDRAAGAGAPCRYRLTAVDAVGTESTLAIRGYPAATCDRGSRPPGRLIHPGPGPVCVTRPGWRDSHRGTRPLSRRGPRGS